MNIETIWNDFCSRIAEIELYGRSAKEVAQQAIENLSNYETDEVPKLEELIESNNLTTSINDFTTHSHAMFFPDAITGEFVTYGLKNLDIADGYQHIKLQLNKQYQWLLADAYEAFEVYLDRIYAHYGMQNHSFWSSADYGDVARSEIPYDNFEWHEQQVEKKSKKPHSILNKFRRQFSDLEAIEKNNKLDINLKLAIILIEKSRHIIVHKGGEVFSKDMFISSVAEKSGIASKDTNKFISTFFCEDRYPNLIIVPESIINEILMAYANLLYEKIKNA